MPKPAGAEMRVSLRLAGRLSFNRSIKRGRKTTFSRGGGILSFVAKIGTDICQLYIRLEIYTFAKPDWNRVILSESKNLSQK